METCRGCLEAIFFAPVGNATAWTFDGEPTCQFTDSGLHEPVLAAEIRPLDEVLQEYMDNVQRTGVSV